MQRTLGAVVLIMGILASSAFAADDDPWLWLEDVDGEKALEWVRARNEISTKEIQGTSEYPALYDRVLEIMDSDERIALPSQQGGFVYNFWQDATHERGILRRTTLDRYRADDPQWETVLDIDALAEAEGRPWVYKGRETLMPEGRLCMVSLSAGGGDAVEMREFDLVDKAFVDGGFMLPVAKQDVAWKDPDTLWVASDFGEGSMTESGYARIVKEWKRGTGLDEARTLFEANVDDVFAYPTSIETTEGIYHAVYRVPEFFRADIYLERDGELRRIPVPEDVDFQGIFRGRVLVGLRSDWTVGGVTYPQGALLAAGLDQVMAGDATFDLLFTPSERISFAGISRTRDHLLMTTLDNVHTRIWRLTPDQEGWSREELPLPGIGTGSVLGTTLDTNVFFLTYEDFLTPRSLFVVDDDEVVKLQSLPAFFPAEGMNVVQNEATSKDGTRIPYFLVTPKGYEANGQNPTALHGYGGFEVPLLPRYAATDGANWLARGGVHVVANLRGGGEFGPRWHEAALRENRIKSFEDFIAVAEDLIARKVTSPENLGIVGGSQGGLLVGGAFTMRPDLFGAVVCQVPLLDMKRFNHLLAGASWMAEYGNPDLPEDWAFIQTWSPYHLVKEAVRYPKVFFWTTTRDDRVHPGHARKMVARMEEMGHPVWYFENIEGGHGAGSTNRQRAEILAMEYSYLWMMLK